MNENIIKSNMGYDMKTVYNEKIAGNLSFIDRNMSNGKVIRVQTGRSNKMILPGRIVIPELIFGVTPNPEHHPLLNEMLGITHSVDALASKEVYSKRKIGYFCIGNGATNPVAPKTKLQVKNTDTKLYNMVPFRCVPINNDLLEEDREQYRLKKKISINGSEYYAYYAKKLDVSTIYVKYNGADYIPDLDHTLNLPDGDVNNVITGEIAVYTTFNIVIAPQEYKEWYQLNHNTLEGAALSEAGLIMGLDAVNTTSGSPSHNDLELSGAECVTKFIYTDFPFDDPTTQREMTYTVSSI